MAQGFQGRAAPRDWSEVMRMRSFLFLQGVASPFFARLADRLLSAGHQVFRVNFNGGDMAYWFRRPSCRFREKVEELPAFLDKKIRIFGITDIVLFGDRRPVHRFPIEWAKQHRIRIHVFEEGYLRPYWVTLERDGVNAHSLLPRDPDWYWRVGQGLPDFGTGKAFVSPFWIRALHDVLYHAASAVNPVFFPGYRTHHRYMAPIEGIGYVCHFAKLPFHERRDKEVLVGLINDSIPYFLLPLQMNNDAQIRDHSPFDDMNGLIEHVMRSFAHHGPGNVRLLIKNHPLDKGLVNYPNVIRQLERRFDLIGRVHYLETGDLVTILHHARGVVTVNSTVGTWALQLGCPVIALSNPIYNLPGLTFQGTLDEFWCNPVPPDAELFRRFRNTVIHATQVNGGFYSPEGIKMAVQNSLRSLESDRSPLEELLLAHGYR
jgi:capsular polysaccharide export protein